MGGFDESFTSLDQAKPKTFVEKLMLGEVDFDGDDEDDPNQEAQINLNCEMRMAIVSCFPGLVVLLKENTVLQGILKYQVLPLFFDLCEDKDFLVRVECARAFPIICQ